MPTNKLAGDVVRTVGFQNLIRPPFPYRSAGGPRGDPPRVLLARRLCCRMAEYGDTPRHKFVVGVHNPDVPSPWDYALSHGFDFACTFISRAQLQSELLSLSPHSPEFNRALCRNALLRPSGMSCGNLKTVG